MTTYFFQKNTHIIEKSQFHRTTPITAEFGKHSISKILKNAKIDPKFEKRENRFEIRKMRKNDSKFEKCRTKNTPSLTTCPAAATVTATSYAHTHKHTHTATVAAAQNRCSAI